MKPGDLPLRLSKIRLLTLDVDGVLTDGRIQVDDDGRETRVFHVLDGIGIKLLQRKGIEVAWITGSRAPAVAHRARQLAVTHLAMGADDKLAPWQALCRSLGLDPQACAHMGDDLPDLPVMQACVLAVSVPHATAVVRAHAHYVTLREGGMGAVRELCDLLLAAQTEDRTGDAVDSARNLTS